MPLINNIEITRAQQLIAFIPLILVGVMNKVFTIMIPKWYPSGFDFSAIGMKAFGKVELSAVVGIWSVELALIIGILTTLLLYWKRVVTGFQAGLNTSIGGALLATMNTGAEFGFGGVIAKTSRLRNYERWHLCYFHKSVSEWCSNDEYFSWNYRLGIRRNGNSIKRNGR